MVYMLDSEMRERHAVADRSIEACIDLLSNAQIQRATNGLAEQALHMTGLLYVPNLRDGIYEIDASARGEEGLPLIISKPEEKIRAHCEAEHSVTPQQWGGIFNAMEAIDPDPYDPAEIKEWLLEDYRYNHKKETFKLPKLTADDGGTTWSPGSRLWLLAGPNNPKGTAHYVDTRPITTLNKAIFKDDAEGYEGSVLFHELVHGIQHLRGIIYPTKGSHRDLALRFELEAYWAHATADEIYYGISADDNPTNWNSLAIEAIRRRINATSDDPFKVTRQLSKAIKKSGRNIL